MKSQIQQSDMERKHIQRKYIFIVVLFILGGVLFTQCSDSYTGSTSGSESTGTLVIDITDAPFPSDLIDEANVTINKIEIRRSTEDTASDYPFLTLSEKDTTLNLLDLTNEATATLVDLEIEAGSFDLVRLYVSEASISVVDTAAGDTTTHALMVPSGAETGIKIFVDPAITVEEELTSELLLDFDVSKSFIVMGDPHTPAGIKGFNFTPVIRAANQSTAGRINGLVHSAENNPVGDATVWVSKADTVFSSTISDSTGFYALIGLPEGNYDLHAAKTDYDTTSVNGVSVTPANKTTVDLTLTQQ